MTPGLPPIWIISLPRSVERRAIMADHMNSLGFPYEFVDAVDGSKLSAEELAALYSREEAFRLLDRPLTHGEIGCALSHLELCRRLIDSGLEEAIVLEDDARLEPALREVMERRHLLPEGWDLIHLHIGNPAALPLVSIWGKRSLGGSHKSVRFTTPVDGSYAYLLRRSGAEKILKQGYPVRLPADHYTGGNRRSNMHLNLYGIDPPVASARRLESTMPEAYTLRTELEARRRVGPLRSIYEWVRERAARVYKRVHPFYRL
jgi:glycosyl transferase family 25